MNVSQAFRAEQQRTMQFAQPNMSDERPDLKESQQEERPQPAMFQGSLKHYQLKGLNWIANLYDQVFYLLLRMLRGLSQSIHKQVVQKITELCLKT